ncbi:synaptotagmin-17-like [Pecten maximus]|uniref:synaptotagmin-17-like n=1 Tax=Pecten maximus TaxID=6579 RepID=UPI001458E829|nr:synaptotagmin-17-like [Pecten maximus]XP_033751190.1 synaptotagmin-17-like [Pecten maximus]XP_033751200.1 synaptotagmin-17-like [Pecten maximus]XP_033751208.1 synaptotagmin-17-like [Pecten maximus]XP_033751214.1 synaptotagmin-17-like [Pecten maximus]XP_033751215.1 synaptotagmin-17-like [Pecten maximus]XP_033751216.1 synaptotagmin-17-like [Pecten maximus]XP_033751224.1 synaptotagmin-17-like [Pecten maximus]XP_033751233.1 synaptotagmin-17-like [Pecten maximus]XP_033751237.1 synaptotagmin-
MASTWWTKSQMCAQKIVEYVCCQDGGCCECCLNGKKQKLTKSDIQHSFRHSNSRLDSTSSNAESYKSFRDRVESDSATSRTDSVSSASQISGDFRKGMNTPIIDMKPIEFWAANKESVQPRQGRRRLPSETEISIENFQRDLYEVEEDAEPCLTDEEKLAKFQLGQIHIGLQYEVSTKVLVVKVIESKDLPPPYCLDENKQDMAHSNPYCKVCLLPDQKNSQQTSVQRKTQNPTWNEYFMFEIPFHEAQMRTLEILIKDFDRFSRHCIIGQVYLPLSNINLIKGGHMWKPLMPSTKERQDLGEILLSLNYLPSAGRLNIDVIKAKQLLQTDMVGGSDPFVKVTMVHFEKPIKTKKTTCKKNTIDPVFNESVSFNVTPQQLENTSIVVTVWDYNSKSRDDFVGRVVIGKYGTGPHEFTHWSRMLNSHRSPVAQWHSLRTRQECDQVSPASIAVP